VRGMPVLVSFASWQKFKPLTEWMPSYDRLLIDSGAYSELNSGTRVVLSEYISWAKGIHWADAYAGLDDIGGDWRRSLKNYESGGFPTFHDTDPPELLDELIALSRERGCWLGHSTVGRRRRCRCSARAAWSNRWSSTANSTNAPTAAGAKGSCGYAMADVRRRSGIHGCGSITRTTTCT